MICKSAQIILKKSCRITLANNVFIVNLTVDYDYDKEFHARLFRNNNRQIFDCNLAPSDLIVIDCRWIVDPETKCVTT